jgi:polysaccharide export outer membrane protein
MGDRSVLAGVALLAILVSVGAVAARAVAAEPGVPPGVGDYRIHGGDRLLVGVYDDPKMPPMDITVTPDGKFSFPLVGMMIAGGKTPEQLRMEMETKLRKFVAEPIVTVTVTEVKGNVAYVIGQVNKPGAIVMNPAVNILQALSIVGGGNPYAKLDSIIVIRNSPGGQRVLNFHYGQVSSGRSLEQNVQLESGDVVVVP